MTTLVEVGPTFSSPRSSCAFDGRADRILRRRERIIGLLKKAREGRTGGPTATHWLLPRSIATWRVGTKPTKAEAYPDANIHLPHDRNFEINASCVITRQVHNTVRRVWVRLTHIQGLRPISKFTEVRIVGLLTFLFNFSHHHTSSRKVPSICDRFRILLTDSILLQCPAS